MEQELISKCLCGCNREVKKGNKYIYGHNKGNLGKKHSRETKIKISNKLKGRPLSNEHKEKLRNNLLYKHNQLGTNNFNWKGGTYIHWHNKAWKLFGKDRCELCNITLHEHKLKWNKRFDMHNALIPKDYTVMKPEAWQCLCMSCHGKIEGDLK